MGIRGLGVFHEDPPLRRINGHTLLLGDLWWRCTKCEHSFDAANDAEMFACGTPCVHRSSDV